MRALQLAGYLFLLTTLLTATALLLAPGRSGVMVAELDSLGPGNGGYCAARLVNGNTHPVNVSYSFDGGNRSFTELPPYSNYTKDNDHGIVAGSCRSERINIHSIDRVQ